MSITIKNCGLIEDNILKFNIQILNEYLNDNGYSIMDKDYIFSNIFNKFDWKNKFTFYDFLKNKDNNIKILIDKLKEDKGSFFSLIFRQPDYIVKLARIIQNINEIYNIKTIPLFEFLLLKFNMIDKDEIDKIGELIYDIDKKTQEIKNIKENIIKLKKKIGELVKKQEVKKFNIIIRKLESQIHNIKNRENTKENNEIIIKLEEELNKVENEQNEIKSNQMAINDMKTELEKDLEFKELELLKQSGKFEKEETILKSKEEILTSKLEQFINELNKNSIITIDDFFIKMILNIIMYYYLCSNTDFTVNIDNYKQKLETYYKETKKIIVKIIPENTISSNIKIKLEPYGISSIISIKIIKFVLSHTHISTLLIQLFKQKFRKKMELFLKDENIKSKLNPSITTSVFGNSYLAEYLYNLYNNYNLPFNIENERELFSKLDTSDNKKIFLDILVNNINKDINNKFDYEIIITKLALMLVVYNYYYNYTIDEECIDTYLNYIISLINFILRKNKKEKNIEDIKEFITLTIFNINKNNSIDYYKKTIQSLLDLMLILKTDDISSYKLFEQEVEKIKKIIEYYDNINKIKSKEELENLKIKLEKEEVFYIKLIQSIYLKKESELIKIDQIKSSLSEMKQKLELLKESQIKSKKKLRKTVKLEKQTPKTVGLEEQTPKTVGLEEQTPKTVGLEKQTLKTVGLEETLKISKRNKLGRIVETEEVSQKSELSIEKDKLILVKKILKDKLYQLIFYLKLKDKEFDFTIINNKNFYYTIFRGYDSIIQNLKEYSPMFKTSSKKTLNNSKNIKEFAYLVMDANDNKFNYYNYGSEASLLFLLKPDMTLEEIRNYIIILKDEKNKNSKLKDFIYTFDDYCYKIGYDLALSLYIFTDISLKIKLEILSNIIKDIVKDGYRTINDDYMNKIEIYFDNMINEPKFKTDIERIFNNDLYRDNNEQKQLKYNLYMHKYKEFKENNKTILLWFINNVILRF